MSPQLLSVLSEPNRLDIVELLYKHPYSVNEIVNRLSLNQPQVSKHLRVLSDAGIVKAHPIAQQRIYALSPKPFKDLDKWLGKFREIWEEGWRTSLDKMEKVLQNS